MRCYSPIEHEQARGRDFEWEGSLDSSVDRST